MLGHLLEMAQGSNAELHLNPGGIHFIPEAVEFARMGILPAGMYRNRSYAEDWVDCGGVETAVQDLLYDPQTAGGLAIAVAPEDADTLYEELKGCVPSAQRIGKVAAYTGGKRIYVE
jgi:selenide,water dikinase